MLAGGAGDHRVVGVAQGGGLGAVSSGAGKLRGGDADVDRGVDAVGGGSGG